MEKIVIYIGKRETIVPTNTQRLTSFKVSGKDVGDKDVGDKDDC